MRRTRRRRQRRGISFFFPQREIGRFRPGPNSRPATIVSSAGRERVKRTTRNRHTRGASNRTPDPRERRASHRRRACGAPCDGLLLRFSPDRDKIARGLGRVDVARRQVDLDQAGPRPGGLGGSPRVQGRRSRMAGPQSPDVRVTTLGRPPSGEGKTSTPRFPGAKTFGIAIVALIQAPGHCRQSEARQKCNCSKQHRQKFQRQQRIQYLRPDPAAGEFGGWRGQNRSHDRRRQRARG